MQVSGTVIDHDDSRFAKLSNRLHDAQTGLFGLLLLKSAET